MIQDTRQPGLSMRPKLRLFLAFGLGALMTLLFAPFGYWPVGIISFAGLFLLLDRCDSRISVFWTGWFFGWGHFIFGLYWIVSAFLVEPEKFAWMIPFPLLGLPALLALFPAVAILVACILARPGPGRVIMIATTWTLAEMARGHVLTGFPWNLIGYAFHFDETFMQPAAWIGIYGLSFIAVLGFGAVGLMLTPSRHAPMVVSMLALIGLIFFVAQQRIPAADTMESQFKVRIVQGNIAQRDKWQPDLVLPNLRSLLDLSQQKDPQDWSDLVIWPETAATFRLEDTPQVREALGAVVQGARADGSDGLIVTGAPSVRDTGDGVRLFNSAHVINVSGNILATADKHHLVPFGEYLPLRDWLEPIGLASLAQGGLGFSPGPSGQTLKFPGLPDAALLICYEAIFPSRSMRDDRPGWLLNLTNDGWFGNLTGPDQHFMMTRFRAVEQGLPLVRAAGTGISGVVDPYGRVIGALKLGVKGVLGNKVPKPSKVTLFSRTGSLPILIFGLILLAGGLIASRRRWLTQR